MRRSLLLLLSALLAAVLLTGAALAQEKSEKNTEQKSAAEGAKPVFIPPAARLAAAKTAFVKNAGGSDIAYNVIESALEGWGRFRLVDSPQQADIILEVTSPDDAGGVSVSSSTRTDTAGRPEQTTTTSRNLSSDTVRLVAFDARTHVALWSASERAKSALRQKAREDNLVDAAGLLVRKLRDRLEPLPPKSN